MAGRCDRSFDDSWNLRYWPGYPQTAQDMSPRITDTGCPKGTPQGHALATLINKFSWRRDCRESYTTRRCACSVRWSTKAGAAPIGERGRRLAEGFTGS